MFAADILDPPCRVLDRRNPFVGRPGFKHEHGGVGALDQPPRDNAPGRACADDDIVVPCVERIHAAANRIHR